MSELSPVAQAVLDAVNKELDEAPWDLTFIAGSAAAAALRAAADQVVPLPRLPYDSCCDVHAAAIRADLLAIAVELEAQ